METPIPIRGHTLLCLQGFRGEGYDEAFIAQMRSIHEALSQNPNLLVIVKASPDTFCEACPHWVHQGPAPGCHLHGRGTETQMVNQDRDVLKRLGLKEGQTYPWQDILKTIAVSVRADDLKSICGNCPWLPLGYCAEGLENLDPTK